MSMQVGGELFKVPRCHLEKGSLFFQSLFASRDQEGIEGRTDEHPIRLDETVTATEFETFLDMIYPTRVTSLNYMPYLIDPDGL
jgi:hypothetical protein